MTDPTPVMSVRDICKGFKTISYSRKDVLETRREIIGHNAAYTALCGAKP